MTIFAIARDVLKEAVQSKLLLAMLLMVAGFLLLLTLSLDLDVVDGALAGSRLFGNAMTEAVVPVDVFLRPVFQAMAWVIFYMGLLFGVVVTADIAPRLLQAGRIEHLLALPVRRFELVVGTYLGVCGICAVATGAAVGGMSLILFVKAEMVTVAPVAGAAMAFVAFAAIYAVMLLVGAFFRSAALSAVAGLSTFAAGVIVSEKETILNWISSSAVRTVLDVLSTPIPNLRALADLGAGAAAGEPLALAAAGPVIAGTFAFAAFGVAMACAVVQSRDY